MRHLGLVKGGGQIARCARGIAHTRLLDVNYIRAMHRQLV